jgi:hypothetical protein
MRQRFAPYVRIGVLSYLDVKVARNDVLEVGLRRSAGHLGLQESAVVPQQLLASGVNSVQPDIRPWDRGYAD